MHTTIWRYGAVGMFVIGVAAPLGGQQPSRRSPLTFPVIARLRRLSNGARSKGTRNRDRGKEDVSDEHGQAVRRDKHRLARVVMQQDRRTDTPCTTTWGGLIRD